MAAIIRPHAPAAQACARAWTADPRRVYIKNSAGTGEEDILFADKSEKYAGTISRDGRWLVYPHRSGTSVFDVSALMLLGREEAGPDRARAVQRVSPSPSPDGRFIAYFANDSGKDEVYVHEFPEAKSKRQVSIDGGRQPIWSAGGRALYGDAFAAGTPQALFQPRVMGIRARGLVRPWRDAPVYWHGPSGWRACAASVVDSPPPRPIGWYRPSQSWEFRLPSSSVQRMCAREGCVCDAF